MLGGSGQLMLCPLTHYTSLNMKRRVAILRESFGSVFLWLTCVPLVLLAVLSTSHVLNGRDSRHTNQNWRY